MSWRAIVAFRLVTADLDRATQFYAQLGFSPDERRPIPAEEMAMLGVPGAGTRQSMRLGPSCVDLDCFDLCGRPYPADADAASLLFQHLALVTDDAASAWANATRAGAALISRHGPSTLPRSAGGMTAVKFRDPDGHPVEFLQFPNGAMHRWPGSGVLGVDHSAISVADVEASRRFYGANGLTVGAPSINGGPTQVALDDLRGVEVEVVPLQPSAPTPHLELLCYRHPRGGACGSLDPNDIAATRVVWSAGSSALVRDPDEHLHQLEA